MIRVVFAEDNYLVREGQRRCWRRSTPWSSWGRPKRATNCSPPSTELAPDAVLTDIRMPPTNSNEGIEAAKLIRETHPADRRGRALPVRRRGVRLRAAEGRRRRARLPVEGARRRRRRARPRPRRGGSRGQRARPQGGRSAGRRQGPDGALAAGRAHRPRARGPLAHGAGPEQRRDREVAVPHRARRREAHQLPVPQAGPHGGTRRAPPRDGGAGVPPRDRSAPSVTAPSACPR